MYDVVCVVVVVVVVVVGGMCVNPSPSRMITMAMNHYRQRVLRRCVCGWLVEVGRERGRREREEEGKRHRERVQAFLTAASSSVMAMETGQEGQGELEGSELSTSPVRGAVSEERRNSHRRRKTPQPSMWQAARRHVVSILYMYIIIT